ncbi:MAG TPA: hypothetical protein PLP29_13370 [Candidatus Ozemobacteraceae bacterium]|nr:hypothetical protein [Candidatus Ozemobacteraceae bacterium]
MTMESLTVWVGAAMTLCLFSFLWGDNRAFRFAENLFVGASAGYYASTVYFHAVLRPLLLARLWPGLFGAAGQGAPPDAEPLFLVPLVLGCLMLFRLSPARAWLSRATVGFYLGVGTGLTVVYSIQQILIPQVRKAITPLWVPGAPWTSVSNVIMTFGTVACLFYFFFSTEHRGRVRAATARFGITLLMIGFGALFGAAVMGRISILIGRFQFLLSDWLGIW